MIQYYLSRHRLTPDGQAMVKWQAAQLGADGGPIGSSDQRHCLISAFSPSPRRSATVAAMLFGRILAVVTVMAATRSVDDLDQNLLQSTECVGGLACIYTSFASSRGSSCHSRNTDRGERAPNNRFSDGNEAVMAGTRKPDSSCEADQQNESCQPKYLGTLQGAHWLAPEGLF
jgi:hypothetical protein